MKAIDLSVAPQASVDERMTWRQWAAVAVCVLLNVIDGFDILVTSTAAGVIRHELGLSAASLGLVLSASLAGMMLGALLFAPLADRYGRRPLILACLAVELVGMIAAGFASNALELMAFRLATGLGVGAMMPVLNTIVAEVSSPARRNVAITLQAAGYPAGGLAAALAGGALLDAYGWRPLLQSAAAPTALALLSVALFLPESVSFLLARRPADALSRVNATLRRLGKPQLTGLPPRSEAPAASGLRALFAGAYAKALALFASATLLTQFSFYFFLSWLPTVLQPHPGAGVPKSGGSMALNLGGIVGDLIFGALCFKVRARPLTLTALAISFLSVALLGQVLDAPALAMSAVLVAGAALFAAMAGLYATAPEAFPTFVRASGTGFAFSLGRFGGAVSPVIGAYVLSAPQLGLGPALILMGLPLVAAAALLAVLRTDRTP
jgi:benzoate transport